MIFSPAFKSEFLKTAGPAVFEALGRSLHSPEARAAIQRGLGGLGAGMGVGGLAGGGLGAVHGYREARQQGATRGEAIAGALHGASRGALTGAAVGGLGLGALEAAGMVPGAAGVLAGSKNPIGSMARFGQRQVHGLTGWTPRGFHDPAGIREIGAGAGDLLKQRPWLSGNTSKNNQLAAALKAESMGLSSLPGVVRSAKEHGLGATAKALAAQQWHGDPMSKAMMLGAVGLPIASELARGKDGEEGRAGRLLGAAGNVAMLGTASMPLSAGFAAAGAGRGIKKMIGALRRPEPSHNPAPPETSPSANGMTQAVERQYSDRAMGEVQAGTGAMS